MCGVLMGVFCLYNFLLLLLVANVLIFVYTLCNSLVPPPPSAHVPVVGGRV